VLSFRAHYNPPSDEQLPPTDGLIASYALGDDYHRILKRRLFQLMDKLKELDSSLDLRALVDTAPLLEKRTAVEAGIGWQGKHSNIITRDAGSWFFLAEVLLNRELAPTSPPGIDRCGQCTDCIDICPTQAIVAPYVVDARRCISYLTIELRGGIPTEFRAGVGNHIFGCDDCQTVCPWNRFAQMSPIKEFAHRPELVGRSLIDWMRMSASEWDLIFRKSAVRRPRFEGFRRNVAIALGNSGDPQSIDCLVAALSDVSPLVRGHVAWALGCFTEDLVLEPLSSALDREGDEGVLQEIRAAIQSCRK
jgi:epoxyqueuosine reductase